MTAPKPQRWLDEPPTDPDEARAARSFAAYAEATAEQVPDARTRARLARSVAEAHVAPRRRRATTTVLLVAAAVLGVGLAVAAIAVPWRAKPTNATATAPPQATAVLNQPSAPAVVPSAAEPAPHVAPSAAASVVPEVVRPTAPVPRPSSSVRELESQALAGAVAALRRERNPDRALALLDEYRAEFPRGALSVEASLVRVDALLALGRRNEALRVLEQLPLEKLPRSLELRKLRDNLRQGR